MPRLRKTSRSKKQFGQTRAIGVLAAAILGVSSPVAHASAVIFVPDASIVAGVPAAQVGAQGQLTACVQGAGCNPKLNGLLVRKLPTFVRLPIASNALPAAPPNFFENPGEASQSTAAADQSAAVTITQTPIVVPLPGAGLATPTDAALPAVQNTANWSLAGSISAAAGCESGALCISDAQTVVETVMLAEALDAKLDEGGQSLLSGCTTDCLSAVKVELAPDVELAADIVDTELAEAERAPTQQAFTLPQVDVLPRISLTASAVSAPGSLAILSAGIMGLLYRGRAFGHRARPNRYI